MTTEVTLNRMSLDVSLLLKKIKSQQRHHLNLKLGSSSSNKYGSHHRDKIAERDDKHIQLCSKDYEIMGKHENC